MGIQGLLPLLKSIHKPCNLKKFAGQTIGVDAYGWLHRGTVTCAVELAQGKPTTKFVDFAMSRVRMLVHFGVRPYLVFDGDYLPSKSGTERDRAARRRESKNSGLELLRMGKTAQAHLELQKSVDVTPEMARQLIEELKNAKIDYVVAPFEADSQLVYLERQGLIDGILSEDSDLLVFGAKCLLTKLDQYGDCIAINRADFTACREISLVGWSEEEFRWMAILSGCDYLHGIEKMGLKTAYRMIRKHKSVDRIIRAVQFDGKMKVPTGYLESFHQAQNTFLYQWVYCPESKSLVHFTQPGDDVDTSAMDYIGKKVESHIASKVAQGYLHPHTKQPLAVPVVPQLGGRTPMRRTMAQQTPDLKSHQSIESFFKTKRTPLAELDPNSFTPSPSQQRLLQQQHPSWSAEPIGPRPFLGRALTDIRRSHTQTARRAVSDAWPMSTSTSPKRQRLCSDSSLATALKTSQTQGSIPTKSRFFDAQGAAHSPSVKRGTKAKGSAKQDINIWSDDSIEEALSQLPETSTDCAVQRKSGKVAVFRDYQPDESQKNSDSKKASASQDDSQDSATTRASCDNSGVSSACDTQATSIDSQQEGQRAGTEEAIFDACPPEGVSALQAKFAFGNARASLGPTIGEDLDGTESPAAIPCSSPPCPPFKPDTAVQEDEPDFTQADWLAMGSQAVRPLSVAEEMARSATEGTAKGSEDHLVPDSEGEEESTRRLSFASKLDMSRFAFAG